jgi:glycosyltransferase involved in cell wall biosynthesis
MKIYVSSPGRYPVSEEVVGLGCSRVNEVLTKGLAELGHEVFFRPVGGFGSAPPGGVIPVEDVIGGADIYHLHDYPFSGAPPPDGKPWVRGFHRNFDETSHQYIDRIGDNWVFVSSSHARSFGRSRYVWNGIDPAHLVFSETKDDYFLFVVNGLERAEAKGLRIAITLAELLDLRLVVAGARRKPAPLPGWFESDHVTYVGPISGNRKADLFAGARALLFPTTLRESFGLVVAEAQMSGTPVICSNHGACPELIDDSVGFVCDTMDDYIAAVAGLGRIRPRDCREKALRDFHYLRMARDYLAVYESELGGP